MMKQSNQREGYIDVSKGLGILLVVYAHIILNTRELTGIMWIKDYIYAFHMPLFFILSGFCLGVKLKKIQDEFNLWKEVKRIVTRLLGVYFVWSIIYIFFLNPTKEVFVERLYATATLRGIAPIWFLGALFLGELAMLLLYNIFRKTKLNADVLFFLVMLAIAAFSIYIRNAEIYQKYINNYVFITVGRIAPSMVMIILGYLFCKLNLFKRINRWISFVLGISIMVGVGIIVDYTELSVNLHLFLISDIVVFYIVSIMGTVGIIMLSYSLEKYMGLFRYLGKNSLAIMLLHYIPFRTMQYSVKIAIKFATNEILVSIISTTLVIAICLVAIMIIDKKLFIVEKQ